MLVKENVGQIRFLMKEGNVNFGLSEIAKSDPTTLLERIVLDNNVHVFELLFPLLIQEYNAFSPLFHASQLIDFCCEHGAREILEMIINDGRINVANQSHELNAKFVRNLPGCNTSAISVATKHNNIDIVKMLLLDDRFSPSILEIDLLDTYRIHSSLRGLVEPIISATQQNNYNLAKLFMNDERVLIKQKHAAFHIGCKKGNYEIVELFCEMGIQQDEWNDSPLIQDLSYAFTLSCMEGQTEIVHYLSDQFSKYLEWEDILDGLKYACMNGHESTVQLLSNHARVDSLMISDSLKYACRTGFKNVVQILLSSLSIKKCDNRSTQDESIEIEIEESNTNSFQNQLISSTTNSATNNIQNALHDAIVHDQFLCFQEIVKADLASPLADILPYHLAKGRTTFHTTPKCDITYLQVTMWERIFRNLFISVKIDVLSLTSSLPEDILYLLIAILLSLYDGNYYVNTNHYSKSSIKSPTNKALQFHSARMMALEDMDCEFDTQEMDRYYDYTEDYL